MTTSCTPFMVGGSYIETTKLETMTKRTGALAAVQKAGVIP
jgi:hypothetical protein